MEQKKITLLVSSCDKFSDIWEVSLGLLNKNWADRNIRTILLTDKKTDKEYKHVEVISKDFKNVPKRIESILELIETEYIFFILDDYLLIDKIDNGIIVQFINAMKKYKLDYISFYSNALLKKRIDKKLKLYEINLETKKDYAINLYPGIWKKAFLERTLERITEETDVWNYEVSLTRSARKYQVKCAYAKGNPFPFLDAIRKGKFLHKADSFLRKNHLYTGNRKTISYFQEYKLIIIEIINSILPVRIKKIIKKFLRKFGVKFYS